MKSAILVPVDLSEPSLNALEHAAALAKDRRAILHLLYVVDRAPTSKGMKEKHAAAARVDRLFEEEAAKTVKELDRLASRLRRGGIDVKVSTSEGRPAAEILKAAKDGKVDLIAMGTHGRTGLRHLLMGSVAESVMRQASCPVLILRTTPKARSRKTAA